MYHMLLNAASVVFYLVAANSSETVCQVRNPTESFGSWIPAIPKSITYAGYHIRYLISYIYIYTIYLPIHILSKMENKVKLDQNGIDKTRIDKLIDVKGKKHHTYPQKATFRFRSLLRKT